MGRLRQLFTSKRYNDRSSDSTSTTQMIAGDYLNVAGARISENQLGNVLVLPALVDPHSTQGKKDGEEIGPLGTSTHGGQSVPINPRNRYNISNTDNQARSYARRSALLEDLQRIDHSLSHEHATRPYRHSIDIGAHQSRIIDHNAGKPSHHADRHRESSALSREHESSSSSSAVPAQQNQRRHSQLSRSQRSSTRHEAEKAKLSHHVSVSRKPVPSSVSETPQSPSAPITARDDPTSSPRIGKRNSTPVNATASRDGVASTVDTSVHEAWAPAVTHEEVQKHVKHIRQEHLHREVHTHDVFHRILPINDVQVLPARHFYPAADGTLVEFDPPTTPRAQKEIDAVVSNVASSLSSSSSSSRGPLTERRQFTARRFEGSEGNTDVWHDTMGVSHQRTTWVHVPELEQSARLAAQTEALVL